MIRGKKVIVRPVEECDLELIVRWRNDPENRQFFFTPFMINRGGQKKWYEQLLADRNRFLFMIDTVEGKTVGMVGINNIDWRNQEGEGGQLLMDPEERGKGLVEEAMYLILKYSFEELNLHRIYGSTGVDNPAFSLYKLFGFKKEGVLRQCYFQNGKFRDKVLFALLREEWEENELVGGVDN